MGGLALKASKQVSLEVN